MAAKSSVLESLNSALRDVEHQIWLLRNVHWWYLAPLFAGFVAPDIHNLLRNHTPMAGFLQSVGIDFVVVLGVWWLNRAAVKHSLRPQRDELRSLIDQIR